MHDRAPDDTEAELVYSSSTAMPTAFRASAGGEGRNSADGKFERRTVAIINARQQDSAYSLDEAGFTLVRHESAVCDFYDPAQLSEIYEPEATELVRHLTGASRAVVFDHTFRTDSGEIREARNVRDAVPLVHNDYTERSARQRVRDLLPDEAEALLSRRLAILNIWRSVGGVVETMPLALCDARSIPDTSIFPMERRAKDRIGEMQQATYDPAHRWYWFPKMDRDDALVFKTFDSATDGRARRSLHTAFVNPDAPSDAPPRESVDTRVFAFFDD